MIYSKKQLAALAGGASLEAVMAMQPEEGGADATLEELTAQVAALTEAAGAHEAALAEATSKLAAAQAVGAAQEAALAEANKQIEGFKANEGKMKPAIMGMIKQRALVLGATVPEAYETTDMMVEAYEKVEAEFKDKFKAGRRSLATQTVDSKGESKGFDSRTLAAMKAINIPA